MLQLKPETPDLWDSILPEELARVDLLLQDERLMEPSTFPPKTEPIVS